VSDGLTGTGWLLPQADAGERPRHGATPLHRFLAQWRLRPPPGLARRVAGERTRLSEVPVAERPRALGELGARLRGGRSSAGAVVSAFACAAEALAPEGHHPGPADLERAWILRQGGVAEGAAGAAGVPALACAVVAATAAGERVVVVCGDAAQARDRLASLQPVLQALAITGSAIAEETDDAARRRAYRARVVVVGLATLLQDVLSDRLLLGDGASGLELRIERLHRADSRAERLFLPALDRAIVDDVDGLLVNLAGHTVGVRGERAESQEQQALQRALRIAQRLKCPRDYRRGDGVPAVALTGEGCERLGHLALSLRGGWSIPSWRERVVTLALLAQGVLEREVHYRVSPVGVELMGDLAGQLALDGYESRLLQQLLALKEGVPPMGAGAASHTITPLQCFRQFRVLSGLTWSAKGRGDELWNLYGLPVRRGGAPANIRGDGATLHAGAAERRHHLARWIPQVMDREVLLVTPVPALLEGLDDHLGAAGLTVTGERVPWLRAPSPEGPLPGLRVRRGDPAPGAPLALVFVGAFRERAVEQKLAAWYAGHHPRVTCHTCLALDDGPLAGLASGPAGWFLRLSARRGWGAAGRLVLRWLQGTTHRALSRRRLDLLLAEERRRRLLAFTAMGNR